MASPPALSERIGRVFAIDPAAEALEFEAQWWRWGDLAATADALADQVRPGERVGVLLRNRPEHVGVVLGLLRAGACVVTCNPERGVDRVREDLLATGAAIVAGGRADVEAFAASPRRIVSDRLGLLEVTGTAASGPDAGPDVAVEMLTSGTTGPPKRVPLTYETLLRVLVGAKHYEPNGDEALRLRRGIAIVNSPLVHLGGLFRILQCAYDGRPMCLLERFDVDVWVDAVRRHRPRTASLVPAALRMVLDANVDPDDLASLQSVVSGTAPLAPEDADAFTARYGVPVLVAFAATEFGGGVAGWNLDDHRRFWATKKGSVGRAHPGCELRIVAPESGAPVAPGTEGLLEVRARQLEDDAWVRTTDLARIDDDGFVWIRGRADQAINRGGFKVLPDDVRVALERDPRVRGAAVVGKPDERLGAVPVAAVELRPATSASSEDLLTAAGRILARYEVPTELRVVAALPRTSSGKVDLAAVRSLFTGSTVS